MKTWHAYGIGGGKQMPIDHENNLYKFLQQIQKVQHFKIETRQNKTNGLLQALSKKTC